MLQDIRQAVRGWRRNPILPVAAILTIALGVAANTAVFSVAYAVLFRPLPYPAPDRLVELFERSPALNEPNQTFRVSALNYLTWTERTKTLDAVAAFQGTAFTLTRDGDAARVAGSAVTASLFRVLGVDPLVGRRLRPEDESPHSPRVALISRSMWQRVFGGDPLIIGTAIVLDGERHAIIGVVPDTFREIGRAQLSAAADPQVFVPLRIDPARENRGNHVLRAAGRLRADASLVQARAEMSAIGASMSDEFPATNKGWGIRLVPVQESMVDGPVRPSLLTLLGAVLVVMLIACANVSHLALAKATAGQRDMALRMALGASRKRLARQVLTESLCLAAVSGVLGLLAVFLSIDVLRALLPRTLPRLADVRVDGAVLVFGAAVSLGSGMLAGILPAMRTSRIGSMTPLAQDGRTVIGPSRVRLRHGLVVAQNALATMLLVAGALLLHSFVRLESALLGFEPAGVLTARVGLPRAGYDDPAAIAAFHDRLIGSLALDPAVESAAVATSAPFTSGVRRGTTVRRWPIAEGQSTASVAEHIVSEGFFQTLSVPILSGRAFDRRDRIGSPEVVIVTEATAHQLWPGVNPIGQQLERDGRPYEVVGVAGDVRGASDRGARGGGLDGEPRAAVYLPAAQLPQRTITVLVRGSQDASALSSRLRTAMRQIDPALAADQVRMLDDWLDETIATPRLTSLVAGAFAVIAVLLATIGIYGVVAYTVGLRTPEIGLRMAMGATPRNVLALVLRGGLMAAVLGTILGAGGALLAGRVLRTMLFEVDANDPATFAAAALLLLGVSLAACYVPARCASRVDPLLALRSQ